MKLAGDLAEFSLPDLIQVKSAGRQTAGLRILGPEGNGQILLREGEIVHAEYEELTGEAAFFALIGVKAGYFEAVAVPENAPLTIRKPVRELLIDAHQLAEKGALPRPVRRATLPGVTIPRGEVRVPAAAAARPRIGLFTLGVALALLLGVGAAMMMSERSKAPAAASPVVDTAGEVVVEADALTGAGDRLPELVTGARPARPQQDVALVPTVVLRLRIDSTGRVAEAKVYRSRLEHAAFEAAALEAVEGYRFRPATKAGQPVSVWINWPIDFD